MGTKLKIGNFWLIIATMLVVGSCASTKSTSGLIEIEELKPATITDASKLYASYQFTSTDREQLQGKISEKALQVVERQGHEDAWPEAINQYDKRTERRSLIEQYQAFVLAEFSDKYILIVPANYNKEMDKAMRPEKDFFFLIAREAVKIK